MSSAMRFCLLLPLASLVAAGQTITGSVNGVVVDPTSAAAPGVACTLTARATGTLFKTQTGPDGSFTFNSVPAGAYSLKLEAAGFQPLELVNVMVTVSEIRSLGKIALSVGAVRESVSVTAQAAAIQLSSAERSGVITGNQMNDIAVKGRDFMSLLATVPGVVDRNSDSREAADIGSARGIHINGGSQRSKAVTLDGASILDVGNNVELQIQPNMDSIAEIKVLTSNYQAAFGRNSGGVISMITKSGTKDFHGTGYFFYRHESLNASDFFRNRTGTSKAPYRYKIGGFSVGGPVYIPKRFNTHKDKLFFFVSQERVARREDYGTRFVNTPTELERNGDFSQSFDVNGALIRVKDPLAGTFFPANVVPQNRVDSVGQAILNFFPRPNYVDPDPGLRFRRNYRATYSGPHPRTDTSVRLDANVWPSFQVYYRFTRGAEEQTTPFGIWQAAGNFDLTPPVQFSHPGQSHSVHMTKILSPTLVAEFSFDHNFTEYIFDRFADRARMGNPPRWFTPDPSYRNYIPDVNFGGQPVDPIQAAIGNVPFYNFIREYAFVGNITRVWASHNVQAGTYIERPNQYMGSVFGAQHRGTFNFARNVNNPFDSNHAFANALLGNYNSYTESSSRPDGDHWSWITEWHVQDTWKITRRLTLDVGLRLYHHTPKEDLNRHMTDFNPGLYDPRKAPAMYLPGLDSAKRRVAVDPLSRTQAPEALIGKFVPGSGDTANGMAVGGVNGYPGGLFTWSPLALGPRFGFAYDLLGNGNTAIRGGFGKYIDRINNNPYWSGPPIAYAPTQFYGNLRTLAATSGVLGPSGLNSRSGSRVKHPSTMNFSLGVQHRFWQTVVEASYVGSLVRHDLVQKNINAIPMYGRFEPGNADPTLAGKPLPDDFLRPYKGWGGITSFETMGSANYHALQMSANRRFTRGLQFGVAYTWSKVLGLVAFESGGTDANVSPYFKPRERNYGLLPWDRTHVFNLNYMYELPTLGARLGWRPAHWLLDNWRISGITSFSSGEAFTPGFGTTDGADTTGSNENARVTVTGDPHLPKGERTFERNFRTEMFARTPTASFGNAGIGILRGPGINNWDMSVSKRVPLLSEGRFLQFRAELFNAWNHTQFSGLFTGTRFDTAGRQTDPSFGAYSGARRPRIIQLSVKLFF